MKSVTRKKDRKMTQQYDQPGINTQQANMIAENTPDGAVRDVVLGAITEDGDSQTFLIDGGGSDPDDVSTNNYVVEIRVTFTRDAGVVAAGASNIALDILGAAPVFAFAVDGDDCILRITPPASRYTHRLLSTPINY